MSLCPEQVDHINLVNWFSFNHPELAADFHHFANERRTSFMQGKILKRMGVKKGVADFFLALPIGKYYGLWIELKVGDGKLSKEQIKFLERKSARGYAAVSVWGFEAAKRTIETYLNNTITDSYNNMPKTLYNS